jgi:hypothetical protein
MKTHPPPGNSPGSLAATCWDVPIRVRLAPYVQFSRWLDGELEKLVERWSGRAAPSARRGRRR